MDWNLIASLEPVGGLPGPDGGWDKGLYALYCQSDRWATLHAATMEKFGGRCQFCGISNDGGAVLQAHHKNYDHVNGDPVAEMMDLILLCKDCHEKWHQIREQLPNFNEKYRFAKIQLMSPAIPALIEIRNQEIKYGAILANKLLKGKSRGGGFPNKLYSMIADEIRQMQPEWMHTSPYPSDIEKYLPGLFEGIQKEENRLHRLERDGT